jgi:serine/threonine-protein kinase
LGQVLAEQGALSEDRRLLLEALVAEHVAQHGGDPEESLAAVSSIGSLREELTRLRDPVLEQSLATLSSATPRDLNHTQTASVDATTSPNTRFRILRPHARGGLGEVFVARDEELGREVALKQIQERHADDPQSRARFLLEAQVTGGLEHPGIIPVYGLGQYENGRPFYAMRFVRGDSLKDAIERFHKEQSTLDVGERTLRFRKLLQRFVDVCNAVAYAHSRGVLHRDLKPGNVMLGSYGETLVVDWGLAKAVGRPEEVTRPVEGTFQAAAGTGSTPTQTGAALGTPQYMSPEQANGKVKELGPATDVYSLGATLYCLLTGKAPFEGADPLDAIVRVTQGDFPLPRLVKPETPAALEAICCKAMALRPSQRYASPRGVADDIEHWLADEPVSAFPEPWTIQARRWAGRHRALVTSSAAALVVATVGMGIAAVLLGAAAEREGRAKQEALISSKVALEAAREAEIGREQARVQRDGARRNLYLANMHLAERAWDEAKMGRLEQLLEECRPRDGEPDLRGFEWGYLKRLCGE